MLSYTKSRFAGKNLISLMFLLVLSGSSLQYSQWSNDPTINTPICIEGENQNYPSIFSDVSSGAFIAWTDDRNYSNARTDVYAQYIDSLGFIKWPAKGVGICTASDFQGGQRIISDGNGGIIIIWSDTRNNGKIYGQRITKSGTILWASDGIELVPGGSGVDIAEVGNESFIITWSENRNGDDDIYAQKFNLSGESQWAADGVAICSVINDQGSPRIIADGNGGAIITWVDVRNGIGSDDIYAQRVDSLGNLQWAADGLLVCVAAGRQYGPKIISDDENGAIVVWTDERSGTFQNDLYAQHISNNGGLTWTTNGVPVCTESGSQWFHNIVSDGEGGVIVVWKDERSIDDIYAQRIYQSAPMWQINGIPICEANWIQDTPEICSDGNGGAIIVWQDERDYDNDIYSQRVNSSGQTQWTADGIPICLASGTQGSPKIVSVGSKGAIITWTDERNGITNEDIYAQYVTLQGTLSSVKEFKHEIIPKQSILYQNYPNPFNPSTIIKYSVPYKSRVSIKVFDVIGNEIETLVDGEKTSGTYKLTWYAGHLPAGVYFYRIEAGNFIETKKMVLVK